MLLCMRTTIRLDDQLLIEIKQYAVRSGQTLTAVIEDALRLMLASQQPSEKQEKVKLLTVEGNGTLPGVDLDDSANLLDLMEEVNASD
ncbi:MAG: ribbon-helix-helix domain-containing protein [Anaerolineae bacterium]|nr:MAG: ribbon-helix-helix domain-containing protein [Anaerolineae bacterium]